MVFNYNLLFFAKGHCVIVLFFIFFLHRAVLNFDLITLQDRVLSANIRFPTINEHLRCPGARILPSGIGESTRTTIAVFSKERGIPQNCKWGKGWRGRNNENKIIQSHRLGGLLTGKPRFYIMRIVEYRNHWYSRVYFFYKYIIS